MKSLAVLCVVFVLHRQTDFVVSKAIKAKNIELTNKELNCVNELHLDRIKIEKMNNREITPEDDEDYNRFLTCFWKRIDWVSVDGTINYENMEQSLVATVLNASADKSPCKDSYICESEKRTIQLFLQTLISYCKSEIVNRVGNTLPKLQNCMLRNVI